jgi:hypothetical protein
MGWRKAADVTAETGGDDVLVHKLVQHELRRVRLQLFIGGRMAVVVQSKVVNDEVVGQRVATCCGTPPAVGCEEHGSVG